jgi:undecaprenyl-diphosphatase
MALAAANAMQALDLPQVAQHATGSGHGVGEVNLGQAIVYGVVQGLTEFLPVSSTAHLRIVPALFKWDDAGAPFSAVIQLGTTLAVVVYFWRELLGIAVGWGRGLFRPAARGTLEYRLGWYLIIATIPLGVVGLALQNQIETGARNLWLVSVVLILLALVMWQAERVGRRDRSEEELRRGDAVAVGFAQVVSLIPGASRSGTTISAGLFRGLDRPTAARFSFMLSIPAVVLSGLFEARHIGERGNAGAGVTGVAVIFAFIVGFVSISFLMRWIARHSMLVFVFYRIALGGTLIGLLATGVVAAN